MRFIIDKVDFDPKLGRRQNVQFLMDSNHQLFSAPSLEEAQQISLSIFNRELAIGKCFCQQESNKYYFANFKNAINNPVTPPKGWQFITISKLNHEICPDYNVILLALQKLGYEKL